jgi:retron-type reverse transcriptase
VVVNVDIADFFPSTRFSLIRHAVNIALPKWVSKHARGLLADICAYAGALPIGAPTSPAIANIVMRPADASIAKVARRHSLSYTRYADDITLSGEDPTRVLPFVQDVLRGMNYELDHKKTNIFRRGRRQVVTGLVVNDKVSVPRTIRRRLRAAVHRATSQNLPDKLVWHSRNMSVQELEGRIAFVGVAHPQLARRLARELRGVGNEA